MKKYNDGGDTAYLDQSSDGNDNDDDDKTYNTVEAIDHPADDAISLLFYNENGDGEDKCG